MMDLCRSVLVEYGDVELFELWRDASLMALAFLHHDGDIDSFLVGNGKRLGDSWVR